MPLLNKPSPPPAEVIAFFQSAQSIVAYELAPASKASFLKTHAWLCIRPERPSLARLRPTPIKPRNWNGEFTNGLLGDTQKGLAAVHYHLDRFSWLERSILTRLRANAFVRAWLETSQSSMGGGYTLQLDFEYQAFILAWRRCLEYLAVGVAAYFKQELWSPFKDLCSKPLERASPQAVWRAVRAELTALRPRYEKHVVEDATGRKTPRNRLSHYEYLSAGTVNFSSRGAVLYRTGDPPSGGQLLSVQMRNQAADLEAIIAGVLGALVAADLASG